MTEQSDKDIVERCPYMGCLGGSLALPVKARHGQ